ncbi:MAG: hypothetical protein KKA90_01950 [Nanoarchaeota archaeon]|nr:hypothetical protein [Nanoarchaeota archaeon]
MRTPNRIGYEELNEMFPGFGDPDGLISIPLVPHRRYGQVDFTEMATICSIARIRNPRVIFEFGRFDGLTTLCLAQAVPYAQIYTLDLPDVETNTKLSSDKAQYDRDAPQTTRKRWEQYGVNDRISRTVSLRRTPSSPIIASV